MVNLMNIYVVIDFCYLKYLLMFCWFSWFLPPLQRSLFCSRIVGVGTSLVLRSGLGFNLP